MNIQIVTDAWSPQVNGVVFTLQHTRSALIAMGHRVDVIHPGMFRSVPCPTYPEIRLSLFPQRDVARCIDAAAPDALHIATEGPLGLAARRYALRHGMPFTTAYHTRFPEYVQARTHLPLSLSYRFLRWFHGPATRTMVPTEGMRQELIRNGFDTEQLVIWSRGVDLATFHPARSGMEPMAGAAHAGALDAVTASAACPAPTTRAAGNSSADAITACAAAKPATHTDLPQPERPPIFLYAGRVAVEKNINAFLSLSLPGEKWVAGGGPQLAALKARYPDVRFTGALRHPELAQLYRQADVFVFPSQTDTFGLVLLEAMACGCPVAALPSPATSDVLGASGAGVINADLRQACLDALKIPRDIPARYAQGFAWEHTTRVFLGHLQPMPHGGLASQSAMQPSP